MRKLSVFLLLLFAQIVIVSAQSIEPERQWNMYRGHYASGVLDNAALPAKWNGESGENIAWKTEIPGLGHSCPVVWGEHIFVTSAISDSDKGDVKTGIYGSIGSVQDSSLHDWNI